MINGARRFAFDDNHTVVQIEMAAKEFGGTVILWVEKKSRLRRMEMTE